MAVHLEESARTGARRRTRILGVALFAAAGLACQPPTLEVDVPFSAVNWSPQDGAAGVCPTWPISVCFNEPVDPGSLQDFLLGKSATCGPGAPIANGGTVNGVWQRADQVGTGGSANCAVFTPPSTGLTAGACYTIEVEGEDLHPGTAAAGDLGDGGTNELPVTLRSVFQVAGADGGGCIEPTPDAG